MNTGEVVKTTVGDLVLEDRVLPDRTAYQYEAGWWAWEKSDEGSEYFVSDEGIVYGEAALGPGNLRAFDIPRGKVIQS